MIKQKNDDTNSNRQGGRERTTTTTSGSRHVKVSNKPCNGTVINVRTKTVPRFDLSYSKNNSKQTDRDTILQYGSITSITSMGQWAQ
eukprot:m.155294 g.155294  ORF g.155294 m.155294 type:complete len:87 (+) comp38665_c0_seq2:128-388(+)